MALRDKRVGKSPTPRRLAYCAVLSGIALMCSYLESLLPLSLVVPVAGFKLGSANAVSAFAGYRMGLRAAAAVLIVRICLGAVLFGSVTGLIFSLGGAFFAFCVLACGIRFFPNALSPVGVSVASAAAHQIGQSLAAVLLYQAPALFGYLPLQLVLSVFTGSAVGVLLLLLCKRLPPLRGFSE